MLGKLESDDIFGCLCVEIGFILKEAEIKYLVSALKSLCEKGDEL